MDKFTKDLIHDSLRAKPAAVAVESEGDEDEVERARCRCCLGLSMSGRNGRGMPAASCRYLFCRVAQIKKL